MATDLMYVVAAAIQNKQGEILMAQRPEGKPWAGYWEFPGGKIDAGETPEQAMVREVQEETAIGAKNADLIPITFVSKDYENHPHVVMFLYLIRNWVGQAHPQEGQKHEWVPVSDLMSYKPKSLDFDTHIFDAVLAYIEHEQK